MIPVGVVGKVETAQSRQSVRRKVMVHLISIKSGAMSAIG
jgi:hypothetical protein